MKINCFFFRIAIVAWLVVQATNLFASTEIDGLYYDLNTSARTATVTYESITATNYASLPANVTIPSSVTYNGTTFSVTSIADRAFYECTTLESISIPASVTEVGTSARYQYYLPFYGCTALKCVRFEDGSQPISLGAYQSTYGGGLFRDCPLEEVYIGRNITYDYSRYSKLEKYLENYGHSAFYNQSKLVKITISSAVTDIPPYLFYKNAALTTTTMPNVKTIGSYAFEQCSKLTTLNIGQDLEEVGTHAFYGCSNITKLTLPNTITTIGDGAFYNCSSITEVTIGNSLKSIGSEAFYGCASFTALILPDGFTTMGKSAFEGCRKLTVAKLGNSLTAVPGKAFKNCIALSEMDIPATAVSIGDQAFYNDSTIATISMKEGLVTIGSEVFYNNSGITTFSIPGTVTSMGSNSFYGCTNTIYLTLKDGDEILTLYNNSGKSRKTGTYCYNDYFYDCPIRLLYLGRNLKYYFSNNKTMYDIVDGKTKSISRASAPFASSKTLKKVTIGPKVTFVYNHLCNNCDLITSIDFPVGIDSIYAHAFDGCDGLSSVSFKESTEHTIGIGDAVFKNCVALPQVTLPCQLSTLGDDTFQGCTTLKDVVFNNNSSYEPSLTIGSYTFAQCYPITTLSFPGRLKSIGNYTFSDCTYLTDITFQDSKTAVSLGYGAKNSSSYFKNVPLFGNSNLEKLYMGRNVDYNASANYGYSPFYNQKYLTDVTFSQAGTVTYCKDYLLYKVGCCKTLKLPESLTSIGNSTFRGMSSLEAIVIPNNVTTIGTYAFAGDTLMLSAKLSTSCSWLKEGLFSNCSTLQAITIPSVVTKMDTKMFTNCKSLANVNFEDATDLIEMGYGASEKEYGLFRDCPVETLYLGRWLSYNTEVSTRSPFFHISALKNLTFGQNVSVVDKYMFSYCTGLEEVYLPDNITSVGLWGFRGCTALKTVRMSQKLSQVADYGFSECKSLDNVVFPASMTSVANNSFSNCTSLKTLDLGSSLLIIGPSAFENDSTLQSITIPETLYGLGVAAFKSCVSLPNVTIRSISSVGKQAFQGCTGLKWVSLSEKTTSLGENSFDGCSNIAYVKSYAETPPEGLANFPKDVVANGTLFVPENYIDYYKVSPTWEDWVNVKALSENVLVTSITLDRDNATMKAAETVSLTATVGADDADNKEIEWKSADESIATVDAAGVITAVAVGETDITATAADGSGIKATCHVTVEPTLVTSITMSETALSVKKYHEATLAATVLPVTTTNKTLVWTSSNPTIATVDEEGNIKALLAGNTIIKATATDGSGIVAECNLTVTAPITGDSNDDDAVNIVDAVNTVNYILNKVTGTFVFEAADVNSDGTITVSDVTGTTSLIMAQSVAEKELTATRVMQVANTNDDADNLMFDQKGNNSLGVMLDNASSYVAIQADITLPVNAKTAQVKISDAVASTHQLSSVQIDANTLRVIVYSLANNALADAEEIFSITSGDAFNAEDVQISNAIASDADAVGFKLNGRFNSTTSIRNNASDNIVSVKTIDGGIIVSGDTDAHIVIHTTSGVLVKSFALSTGSCRVSLTKGIYLVSINGKTTKITVK